MQDAGIRIARPPLYTGPALFFHWEKAPEFQDVRLRYAVAHAINKAESAAITYGDSGKAQKYMAGFSDQLVPDWIGSGDQGKLKEYEFSTSKADQFMKDAGYAKGSDGFWAKNGKRLEYELVFPIDFDDLINQTGDGLDESKQKAAVTKLALAFNELLPIIPLWQRFGNNPINDKKRVAGWPADGDPIYKNPDGDSFAMTLLVRGTIGSK